MSDRQMFSEDDARWLNDYSAEVSNTFISQFAHAGDRFKDGTKLLRRFTKAVDAVLANGWSKFHAVDEAHNEMCIADAILSSTDPVVTHLEYEPPLFGCAKSIDFRAIYGTTTTYVDVKTITPRLRDRWDQFVKFEQENRFPERVSVILDEEWLGGELWHNMYASRERMLEHALDLERKISEGKLVADDTFFILAFCGHRFHWRESQLEDFISFYYTGSHRPDDPFGTAEAKFIQDKKLSIFRTISRFACLFRPQFSIHQDHLNWRVLPPKPLTFN
jgi:hypothetical protein